MSSYAASVKNNLFIFTGIVLLSSAHMSVAMEGHWNASPMYHNQTMNAIYPTCPASHNTEFTPFHNVLMFGGTWCAFMGSAIGVWGSSLRDKKAILINVAMGILGGALLAGNTALALQNMPEDERAKFIAEVIVYGGGFVGGLVTSNIYPVPDGKK